MKVIRGNENLTKYPDSILAQLVASCISLGVTLEDIDTADWQGGKSRAMVVKAAMAYDALESRLTTRHAMPATEETRLWSDWEGGNVYHERPMLSVRNLIMGHL